MKNKKRTLLMFVLGTFLVAVVALIYKQDSLTPQNTLQGDVRYTQVAAPIQTRSFSFKPTTNATQPSPGNLQIIPAQTLPKPNLNIRLKAICGNNTIEMGEKCDDGNKLTEACAYGIQNCVICNSTCQNAAGVTSYCGNGAVDEMNGEQCDGGGNCDGQCQWEFEFQTVEMSLETYFNQMLNRIIPKETNEYQVPTNNELIGFKAALQLFLEGDYEQAAEAFELLGYKIVRLVDTANNNQVHYVIEESDYDNQGDFEKGWGTLFIKEGMNDGVFFSVPHPKFDTNTPSFGLKAYQALGEALYVSGAHRHANAAMSQLQPEYNISDQSHNDHILSAIGQVFSDGVTDKFIEFHGHETANYPTLVNGGYKGVLSRGAASSTSPFQLSVINSLELNGFDGPGGCGLNFNNILCGTENRLKAAIGADSFLHVELGTLPRNNYQVNAPIVADSILDAL